MESIILMVPWIGFTMTCIVVFYFLVKILVFIETIFKFIISLFKPRVVYVDSRLDKELEEYRKNGSNDCNPAVHWHNSRIGYFPAED